MTLHPEYVVDSHQNPKAVLLPFSEWQRVLESLEELEDIQAYDLAKSKELQFLPFEEAVQQIRNGAMP